MDVNWWGQFLSNQGLAITIVALLLAAAVRYGPRVIHAHLAFVHAAAEQGERMVRLAESQLTRADDLATSHTQQMCEVQRTNTALHKACDLVESCAIGSPQEQEIRNHLTEIRSTLTGEKGPRGGTPPRTA